MGSSALKTLEVDETIVHRRDVESWTNVLHYLLGDIPI
jgi:hypothetical protein